MKLELKNKSSSEPVTWELLTTLEPGLDHLMAQIRSTANDREMEKSCTCRRWYFDFKPQLLLLVGWHRESFHPLLSTQRAYEIAYGALYETLPLCGNCPWCDGN